MAKLSDYFNSTSIRGRANVAKATYASFAILYICNRFRKRGEKSKENVEVHNSVGKDQYRGQASNRKPAQSSTRIAEEESCSCGCSKKSENSLYQTNKHENNSDKDGHKDSPSKVYTHDHYDNAMAAGAAVINSSNSACEPPSSSSGSDPLQQISDKNLPFVDAPIDANSFLS